MVAGAEQNERHAPGMFQALAHRNFRFFWAGAFLSNTGTWMQTVAQAILVYNLTGSPFWLGVDSFMATAPGLLLTLFGGALADTVNRKRLLIFTQMGAGLSALTLGTFVLTGVIRTSADVWVILVLSFVTGCCWALAGPSYQALTVDLVEREDLANAIALNSTQFQLSRVIGPTLAGLTMRLLGLHGCFFANGISYAAILWALWQVRFKERAPTAGRPASARRAIWQDLLAGFRYVRGDTRLRVLLVCSATVALFGAPYLVLMPVFAKQVFGWGETGVSLLMATAGAGAFCGAMLLAYLGDFKHKGRFVLGGAFSASVWLVAFSQSRGATMALLTLFGIGFSMVSFFALCNTLLQQLVTDEMRGRVMSMWLLTFIGTAPVGSFLAGTSAERYGAPLTLGAAGLVITLFVLLVGLRNEPLREI